MEINTFEHALKFRESREDYSVYEARDGEVVYLEHGATLARHVVEVDDLDLRAEWSRFPSFDHDKFFEHLRVLLWDEADYVDEIKWCVDCNLPAHEDDGSPVGPDWRGRFACDSCVDWYYHECDRCEEKYRTLTTVLSGSEVCEHCRSNSYSWCNECDGYFLDEDSDEHTHEPDYASCCEAPAQNFSVRNDGEDPLRNDERTTVTLPAGVIDDEGIARIRRHLWSEGLDREAMVILDLGNVWQTREGNFTKRFQRAVYKGFGEKVSQAVVSTIGTIASEHSRSVDYAIEVTRDLNQSPSDFAHSDSCWWQSYSYSRCTLKSNGGFGLRTFNEWGVNGRAWVMPLKLDEDGDLTPTFETLKPDAFAVFNGYGDLEGYTAARIVSHMAGMTYRKISFTCPPMYVNGDSGYLVAPEEIAEGYTDGSLHLSVDQHSSLFADETTEKRNSHVA